MESLGENPINVQILNLRTLTDNITDEHLIQIAKIGANLEELVISSDKISDEGLKNLKTLKNLKKLHLPNCTALTDIDLTGCENLKKLNLAGCKNLKGLKIENCIHLTAIDFLSFTVLLQQNFVRGMPYLKKVELKNRVKAWKAVLAHLKGKEEAQFLSTFISQNSELLKTSDPVAMLPVLEHIQDIFTKHGIHF